MGMNYVNEYTYHKSPVISKLALKSSSISLLLLHVMFSYLFYTSFIIYYIPLYQGVHLTSLSLVLFDILLWLLCILCYYEARILSTNEILSRNYTLSRKKFVGELGALGNVIFIRARRMGQNTRFDGGEF